MSIVSSMHGYLKLSYNQPSIKSTIYLLSEVEANFKTLETGEFYSEEELLKPLSTGDRGKIK